MIEQSRQTKEALNLINLLVRFPGWRDFSGDCSAQALFCPGWLGLGIRFGITDEDMAARPGLWLDIYPRFRYWLNFGFFKKIHSQEET